MQPVSIHTISLAPFWGAVVMGGTSPRPIQSLVRSERNGYEGDGWWCRPKDWIQRTRGKGVGLMEVEEDRDEILTCIALFNRRQTSLFQFVSPLESEKILF